MSNVNTQLLAALKHCLNVFERYVEHHAAKNDRSKELANAGHRDICATAIAAAEQVQQAEPVAWQFYENGKWWNGDDRIKYHRKNTEDYGIPTRDLYATPPVCQLDNPPTVAEPNGYEPMPADPTPEMIYAGAEGDRQFFNHAEFVYRRMFEVAKRKAVRDEQPARSV